MGGLARLCKIYGAIKINEERWLWDFVNDKPRLESEMTKEEIGASEKAKWVDFKNRMEEKKQDDQALKF